MITPSKKARAKNVPGNGVGMQRRDLYQQAFDHISSAMDNGFYLEAITIIESLISDRLESRLTDILGVDFSFKTLGELIDQSRKSETDTILKNLVTLELDEWRKLRNKAIHEMVKIEEGDTSNWEDHYKKLPHIATKGRALLNKISDNVRSLRNAKLRAFKKTSSALKNSTPSKS